MFAQTIEDAIRNTLGGKVDDVNADVQLALQRAERQFDAATTELMDRVDFGTWVIAGAIIAGFLAVAVAVATASGD